MAEQFILVINEGATGTRAVIVDLETRIRRHAYRGSPRFTRVSTRWRLIRRRSGRRGIPNEW